MSEEERKTLRQQVDDTVIDLRNEIIVQGTNAFLLGRKIVLTGIGLTFLGVDQLHALVQHAIERGEVAEGDVQKYMTGLRQEMSDGTTSAISSRLASVLNHLPGVSVSYNAVANDENSPDEDNSSPPKTEA